MDHSTQVQRSARLSRRRVVLAAMGVTLFAGGLLAANPAGAAFPGANGRIFFSSQRTGSGDIYSVDPATVSVGNPQGDVRQVTSGADTDHEPFVSPDGTKVVFSRQSNGTFNEIFLVAASTNLGPVDPDVAVTLSNDINAKDENPSWYPDNRYVMIDRPDPANPSIRQLYQLDSLNPGTAVPVFSTSTGVCDTRGVVNPADPDLIAFVRSATCSATGGQLMVWDSSTPLTPPVNLSVGAPVGTLDTKPDWHPAGNLLVFVAVPTSGPSKITTLDRSTPLVRTTLWAANTNADTDPGFSPDGTDLTWARFTGRVLGNDIFTAMNVSWDGSGPTGAPVDVTPNAARDEMPNWGPNNGGDPVVPETPLAVVLPAVGGALVAAALIRRTIRLEQSIA